MSSISEEFGSNSISNRLLIIIITIFSYSFFQIRGLSFSQGSNVLPLVNTLLIISFLFLYLVYFKNDVPIKRQFASSISILMLCTLLCVFASQYFNDQSMSSSLYQQVSIYFFLTYFLFSFLYPKPSFIKNLIYYMAIIGAILYILQFFAYPTKFLDLVISRDRGTLRFNLPGTFFRQAAYFMCLIDLFKGYNRKSAIGAVLLLIVAVLSGSRSILALYILLPAVYLLVNKNVKNRAAILLVAVIICISGFFAFQGIINEMNKSAARESSQGENYIRVRASNYFFNRSISNRYTFVLGNGSPSAYSSYGNKIISIGLANGYYLSDVGVVGTIFKFGLIFTLIIIFILFRLLFAKVPSELNFIKLFVIMQILLIFTMIPFFEEPSGIILLVLFLYLIDCQYAKEEKLLIETDDKNILK